MMIWYDIYLLTLHISMLCASNQRSGWSSGVTQPSTDHQLMCVQCVCACVRVCVCTALSGIYYSGPLGNKVIFYRYHRWHHRPQFPTMPHRPFQVLRAGDCPSARPEIEPLWHDWTCAWVGALTNWASRADELYKCLFFKFLALNAYKTHIK